MNIPSGLERTQQALETYQTTTAAEKTSAQAAPAKPLSDPANRLSDNDQPHLSAVANIVSQSLAQTDVRTEKVAAVQAAIAGGSYHVPSSQVAGKLIAHMLGEGS